MRLLRKLAQQAWRSCLAAPRRAWSSYRKGWLLMVLAIPLAGCSVVDNFTGPNPQTPSISAIKAAKP